MAEQPGPAQLPRDATAAVDEGHAPADDDRLRDPRPHRRRQRTAGRAEQHEARAVRAHVLRGGATSSIVTPSGVRTYAICVPAFGPRGTSIGSALTGRAPH